MDFQINSINFVPFRIENWPALQKELAEKYYVPDDAKGETGTKSYDWTLENFGNFYKEIEQRFRILNLRVRRSRFFYTRPNSSLKIHIDGTNKLGHHYWALNFPISVPEDNHYQEWYEYDGAFVRHFDPAYTESTMLEEPDKVRLIDRLLMKEPHFVKVGIPHAVFNHDSTKTRLILSIRFDAEVSRINKIIKSLVDEEAFLNSVGKD